MNKKVNPTINKKIEKMKKEKKKSLPPPVNPSNLPSIGDIYVLEYAHCIKEFIVVSKITEKTVKFEGISTDVFESQGDSLYHESKIRPLPEKKNGKQYMTYKYKFQDNKSVYGFKYAPDGNDGIIKPFDSYEEGFVKEERYF